MARKSKKISGQVTLLFDNMLVQTQAPEGEGSGIPPEPQPTPSTSQPNVSEPQTELLQTETPTTVTHELHTEAHIDQILPSPSTYQRKQRKTQKHRRAKKVIELPQTSVPLDHGADEAVHKKGVTEISSGDSPRRQETIGVLLLRLGIDGNSYLIDKKGFCLRGNKDCSRQSDHQIKIMGQEARKEEKGKNVTPINFTAAKDWIWDCDFMA
ncbi:hypothetical protein Tco_1553032 [Tanacetum coccineum]